MSKKLPSSSVASSTSSSLGSTPTQTSFDFNGVGIIPVETSSFFTVDFRNPNNANSILYSTSLTACAVVLMKELNEVSGKYDGIVTMAHFYPANAYSSQDAAKNLKKVIDNFKEKGGTLSPKTSVILIGGAVVEGEDINDTTPLGPLLEVLNALQRGEGFKFLHHDQSIVRNFSENCCVFANKDGTAITKKTNRFSASDPIALLTKPSASMPAELLTAIANSGTDFYPEGAKEILNSRIIKISDIADKTDELGRKPSIPITDMQSLFEKCSKQGSRQL